MGKNKGSLTIMQHLICGGISGAVAKTFTAPLDTIKVIFQIQKKGSQQYDGFFDALFSIIKRDGVAGLWKGNSIGLLRIAPYTAVKFAAFERYKPFFADKNGELNNIRRLVAGACAGVTAVMCTYPLDAVKTRLTIQDKSNPKYSGVINAFTTIAKEEGIGAFFAGLPTTIFGAIPYEGGQFMMYEFIKAEWAKRFDRPMSVWENLLAGCAAGAFAQSISYPFDTVRKRMQAQGKSGDQYYSGMLDCFVKMAKEEGLFSFFAGLQVNFIKVVPYSAISYTVYEQAKKFFEKKNEKAKLE
ncbi:putative multi-domain containing protein [Aduncisulcus paluster]|uniref:Multi-domain containing protein n=1 Tax=Aduncisulcus paluster TaxID=2918883 RepID=A0ABQ5KQR7_9EUKA|nr:putative multi-domain containing protein [Aduncisulcus paluster]|eukprot:gnl/Carplike_NY0171/97_a134_5820.p1 GENE.gnl/Carplike_NY0171/97_a134_5820~~gnl/Carplike_NY0171/97_a134_5820.p1  ORF type:complete len:311 (+),score=122.41 gnl/Carplike_NY0171/97_a134_5820:39-935(+)